MVKRSMNRAPGPNDNWWAQHKATCGGSFVKVKEPEGFGVKKKKIDSNEPTKGMNSSCFPCANTFVGKPLVALSKC